MSHWFTPAKARLASGTLVWGTADVRAMLVMTNTTVDTEVDAANLAAFTTLDEYNGSGYSRPALASEVVNTDTTNHRAELDAADFTFGTAVGAGSRQAQGMLIYVRVDGTNANDYPVAYIDTGGFPFAGTGSPVTVTVDAEALLWVA